MKGRIVSVLAMLAMLNAPALAQDGFGQLPNPAAPGEGGLQPPVAGFGGLQPMPQQQPMPMPQPMPQPQPQMPQPMPQQQPGAGDQGAQMLMMLQQMAPIETQDHGVQPTGQLHAGAMHGPTPNAIPGGRLVTTAELFQLVMSGQPYALFDVLGGNQTLPGAIPAVNAAQPGSFQDQTQQGFGQFLQQVTGGNQDAALVFYCASSQCWMSYNAALRAINLGYRNVLWYRGGLEAWGYAGLPMMPAGGGMPAAPGAPGMPGMPGMPGTGGMGGMGGGGAMPQQGG